MRKITLTVILLTCAAVAAACESTPKGAGGRAQLDQECKATIALFKQTDPTMKENFFATAHGYAVFPRVTKGGLVVGGAHGRGQVYEQDEVVGYTSLSQGTVGAQIGGQDYAEIIFFQNETSLTSFKAGEFVLAAQASGVAASAGGAATADYTKGVAVFTIPLGGLMGEASVGGQQFTFETVDSVLARDAPETE